jgi:amphi-Trp domain-containing protein
MQMELIEIEHERQLTREQAAAWLRSIADGLSRHNEVAFEREGLTFRVDVPGEVTMSVEIEVGDDGNEIEIEITW